MSINAERSSRLWTMAVLVALACRVDAGFPLAQAQAAAAETALAELKEGNRHHVEHRYRHPHETPTRQKSLISGQHPHAMILSCADSRVPPEIVFDQGLGDLFAIRVAGNITDDAILASIEYAAGHLHTPLLVVMGHGSCGAVTAATEPGEPPGHLSALVRPIRPAVEKARGMPGDVVANAVRLNVEMVVAQIRDSAPLLSEMVKTGRLRVVGAVYSLEDGKVTWLPETASGAH
jgi:carbonic anhydrase